MTQALGSEQSLVADAWRLSAHHSVSLSYHLGLWGWPPGRFEFSGFRFSGCCWVHPGPKTGTGLGPLLVKVLWFAFVGVQACTASG